MKSILILLSFVFTFNLYARNKFESALEKVWTESKNQIYPELLAHKYFTDEKKSSLLSDTKRITDWYSFENILNPFLLSLNVSHTYFYSIENVNYYFMRSLFTTKDLMNPKIHHLGLQTKKIGSSYYVRASLENYPAFNIGLKRGDQLLSKKYNIEFKRNGMVYHKKIEPVFESLHWSFVNASLKSAKIFIYKKKKIGYYHLWTGTHPRALEEFEKAIRGKLSQKYTDGLIIDLRDGFGGAWWSYLDLFFPDRSSYFEATVKNNTANVKILKPPQKVNNNIYTKPIVIISNEGVRSGKEALVYQFKKTKRAHIIGTNTGGMFSMGKGLFHDKDYEYMLYLSIAELFLDGIKVEGIGISPDTYVEYPLKSNSRNDPQLSAAKSKIYQMLNTN